VVVDNAGAEGEYNTGVQTYLCFWQTRTHTQDVDALVGEFLHLTIVIEGAFHQEMGKRMSWEARPGRMKYSSPSVEETVGAFEADGFTHIMVVST